MDLDKCLNIIEILGTTEDDRTRIRDFLINTDIDTFSVKIKQSRITFLEKKRPEDEICFNTGDLLLTVQKL
jgi:hypothetical protein